MVIISVVIGWLVGFSDNGDGNVNECNVDGCLNGVNKGNENYNRDKGDNMYDINDHGSGSNYVNAAK